MNQAERDKDLVITCTFQDHRGVEGVGRWRIEIQRQDQTRVTYKAHLPQPDTIVDLAHWLLGDDGYSNPYDKEEPNAP